VAYMQNQGREVDDNGHVASWMMKATGCIRWTYDIGTR
jgi:hypothetical protein